MINFKKYRVFRYSVWFFYKKHEFVIGYVKSKFLKNIFKRLKKNQITQIAINIFKIIFIMSHSSKDCLILFMYNEFLFKKQAKIA